ncbi:MAG: hypothetical protein EB141_01340 [Verrucomicrobia bacterium]|nr:hypothetical protein [Verrucomicrobiota bacterium]NBU10184.1 hypothetical protein [Pseudomonadota bacterium]NDA65491.1 hypothetical protein [Verrucomicrobiota bacterium]NDB74287.1 hypothetical protein [Verrucomicrobiota bacterium]NDD37617.1 hypothetical protein [Verrucomicrobiota bacterium]
MQPKPPTRGALTLPRTQFLPDHSLTAIAWNDSPDIGFRARLNPYRGCERRMLCAALCLQGASQALPCGS